MKSIHVTSAVALMAATLLCLTARADTLVSYQFATNNFNGTVANGGAASGATDPYASIVDGSLLSSASTIDNNGTAVALTYRLSGTLVNNGSANASYPLIDARLTSAAPNPSLYFQFSLTASSDFDLTSLSYDLATGSSSATTIRGADVQYSLDNFATFVDLGTNGVTGTADAFSYFSIDLGDAPVLDGQTITVRFDPFVNTGAAGGVRFDNIEIDAIPVPEPATLALCGLGGLGALFLKRRKG